MKELIISQRALKHNLTLLRERAAGRILLGRLERDAFGLGFSSMAQFYYDEGLRTFTVDTSEHAARLRQKGFTDIDILVMRPKNTAEELLLLLETGAIAAVSDGEFAGALSALAKARGTVAEAHIRVDCGSGSYGFLTSETEKIAALFEAMDGLAVTGIFTAYSAHLSAKELRPQREAFGTLLELLHSRRLETGLVHVCDGPLTLPNAGESSYALRIGASICGLGLEKAGFRPAACLRTVLDEVHWLPAGTVLPGRGPLRKPLRVGLVPIGTADGIGAASVGRPLGLKKSIGQWLRPSRPAVHTSDGKRLPLACPPGATHMTLDTGKQDIGLGTEVYIQVNPQYCTRVERQHV